MDTRIFKKPYKRQFVSHKQYDHFKTLGAAPLPTFPSSLYAPYYLDDIQDGEKCTAFSGVKERYAVTGRRYDPDCFFTDEINAFGSQGLQQGFTIDQKMQTGLQKNGGFVLAGTVNTTGRIDGALSYLWVKQQPGLDWFDSVRLAIYQLWKKYGMVIPITIGVNWYEEWDLTPNGILGMNVSTLLGGHDIEIAGMETFEGVDYLGNPGTWGPNYGDKGFFRISREVFNKYFTGFGAAYWSDDKTLEVSKLNLFITILQNFVILLQRLINNNSTNGYPPPTPTPAPKPTPTPAPIKATHPLIQALAEGIWEAEGNGKQSGMKYNNPGDIRGRVGNKYIASLGATGYGYNNLAIFPTLEKGQAATVQLCLDVANNELLAYPKPCTIRQFVKIYGDPVTQQEWDNYVAILCRHTGKVDSTTITELL